ncbi:MAG TPA: histidinol-phosphatase HisJ family protein [Clostridia bacterium]|nr:histidinol-phosphatase HisJ family protein [Clostridia bacterium]
MDYHIHTRYSSDGEMTIEEACKRAIKIGLKEIAITDHIDIDWPNPDISFDIANIDEYIQEIHDNKERFKSQLIVKVGIEIGLQPHVLEESAKIIRSHPFDFVIGSIHIIKGMDPYMGDYFYGKTKSESYEIYYRETIDLIKEFDDFDVLGHLGYIKRYFPQPYSKEDEYLHLDLVDEILEILIQKNKGIEVNTSGYKHSSACPMPSLNTIARYKQLGGSIITVGSDAHSVDSIGYGIGRGTNAIKNLGFDSVTSFTSRKPEFRSIGD